MSAAMPLIGITCCARFADERVIHRTNDDYVRAVVGCVGGLPFLIPAMGEAAPLGEIVERLDGLIVTGSPSNIQPCLYGGEPAPAGSLEDPDRDAITLPLIRAVVEAGIPLLGVCRGHQEINVAFGGTLYQRVHEQPGYADHRDRDLPIAEKYAPVHTVTLTKGGFLERLLGRSEIFVNSLHGQGIDRVATGLAVEARAPDGLVECIRVEQARTFALGVQWHPEWRYQDNPISQALFGAFAGAARRHLAERS
jgi:putative glutamine amidotransferase